MGHTFSITTITHQIFFSGNLKISKTSVFITLEGFVSTKRPSSCYYFLTILCSFWRFRKALQNEYRYMGGSKYPLFEFWALQVDQKWRIKFWGHAIFLGTIFFELILVNLGSPIQQKKIVPKKIACPQNLILHFWSTCKAQNSKRGYFDPPMYLYSFWRAFRDLQNEHKIVKK